MANESLEYLVEEACKALLELNAALADTPISHHDDSDEDEEFSGVLVSAEVDETVSHGSSPMSRRLDRLEVRIELRGMIFDTDSAARDRIWKAINLSLLTPNPAAGALEIFSAGTTPFRSFMVQGESRSTRDEQDARRTHVRRFAILAAVS